MLRKAWLLGSSRGCYRSLGSAAGRALEDLSEICAGRVGIGFDDEQNVHVRTTGGKLRTTCTLEARPNSRRCCPLSSVV